MHWLDLSFKDIWLLLLGAIPAWYFARKRLPRGLDWLLTTGAPILPPSVRDAMPELRVQYGSETEFVELRQPQINVIRIVNTGRTDIVPADIPNGIRIKHPDNLLASATVIGCHAEVDRGRIEAQDFLPLSVDSACVMVDCTLPRGTWFDIQILSNGEGGDPEVSGLVVDKTHAMRRLDTAFIETKSKTLSRVFSRSILALIAMSIVGLALVASFGERHEYQNGRVRVDILKDGAWRVYQYAWLTLCIACVLSIFVTGVLIARKWWPSVAAARFAANRIGAS